MMTAIRLLAATTTTVFKISFPRSGIARVRRMAPKLRVPFCQNMSTTTFISGTHTMTIRAAAIRMATRLKLEGALSLRERGFFAGRLSVGGRVWVVVTRRPSRARVYRWWKSPTCSGRP